MKNVRIQNFRCLRDVSVPLRPLTVLIGPNDSGKSAFLAALEHTSQNSLAQVSWDRWRGDNTAVIAVSGKTDEGGFRVSTAGPSDHAGASQLQPLGFYCLRSDGVRMQSTGKADTAGPPTLGREGEDVPALLDYFLRRDEDRMSGLTAALRDLIPGFEKLKIGTPDPSTRRVDLVIEKGLEIPADMASVGVRLILFFVALAYHPTPPKLILIEEPENGVHPKRLEDVIRLLREITQGKHGNHAAQVILTTHSPHLLDAINLEEDQVLIFRRNDDGSRSAEQADKERLANFLDEFMLGEVWFNEGEDGLVGRDK